MRVELPVSTDLDFRSELFPVSTAQRSLRSIQLRQSRRCELRRQTLVAQAQQEAGQPPLISIDHRSGQPSPAKDRRCWCHAPTEELWLQSQYVQNMDSHRSIASGRSEPCQRYWYLRLSKPPSMHP